MPIIGDVIPAHNAISVKAENLSPELAIECHFENGSIKTEARISRDGFHCSTIGHNQGLMDIFSRGLNIFLAKALSVKSQFQAVKVLTDSFLAGTDGQLL